MDAMTSSRLLLRTGTYYLVDRVAAFIPSISIQSSYAERITPLFSPCRNIGCAIKIHVMRLARPFVFARANSIYGHDRGGRRR